MLSTTERLAYVIAALGSDLIGAGAHLRESGKSTSAVARLDAADSALQLIREAIDALVAGDERRCRHIVEMLPGLARVAVIRSPFRTSD